MRLRAWLLISGFLCPAARAMDCKDLVARLNRLEIHAPDPTKQIGIEAELAGGQGRLDGLKEGEYFVYVFDRKLGLVWAKRDPENGQSPKNYNDTVYNGHESLARMVQKLRGDGQHDLIDAGEGVVHGGKAYVSNRSGRLRPGIDGSPLSLAALREAGLEKSATIVPSFGTSEQLSKINPDEAHALAAGDNFIRIKFRDNPTFQKNSETFSRFWAKLAEEHLTPGAILDLDGALNRLDQYGDSVPVSELPKLERYATILRFYKKDDPMSFITEHFLTISDYRSYTDASGQRDASKLIAEIEAAMAH